MIIAGVCEAVKPCVQTVSVPLGPIAFRTYRGQTARDRAPLAHSFRRGPRLVGGHSQDRIPIAAVERSWWDDTAGGHDPSAITGLLRPSRRSR
jgi:hypothetical protein